MKPPEKFELQVKYFQGQNYTPRDVIRRWASENYTAFFWDDKGPYLYIYGKKYRYEYWKIQKNDDGTEIVNVTLKKEE